MTIDKIKSQNFETLRHLQGDEKIGVDERGLIYVVKPGEILGAAQAFFSRMRSPIDLGQTAIEFAAAQLESSDAATGQKNYLELQKKLSSLQMTSKESSYTIAKNWYGTHIEQLVINGYERAVAIALATTDLCYDPNVPENVKQQIRPEPTQGGTSGSYFIKDLEGKKIGIFKPQDEEIYMPNNPRGYKARVMENGRIGPRGGHLQGSSWRKEICAWEIDRGEFAHVPKTHSIQLPFPQIPGSEKIITKIGSFQEFAQGVPIQDLGAEIIAAISVEEVQRVAILDLAIGNSDRNLGNLLYDVMTGRLTPIDHGLALLDSIDWLEISGFSETNCQWLVWPQIKTVVSDEVKNWVLNYDVEAKCNRLSDRGLPASSIRDHKLRMIFLKAAVRQGLTIEKMGKLCMQSSEGKEEPTWLDGIVRTTAFQLADNNAFANEPFFFQEFEKAIVRELENV